MYKILIVDDDQNYRYAVREIIDWKSLNFRIVDEAINGSQAMRKLEECHPNLVITDMNMPLMDGVELIKAAHKKYPEILFVALSAYDDFDFVRESLREGAVDYILKYEMKEDEIRKIIEKVKNRLDELRMHRERVEIMDIDTIKSREIKRSIIYVKEHYQENITLQEAAEQVGLNKNYFSNLFKEEAGETFIKFVNKVRIQNALELLEQGYLKTYEIAEMAGYKNSSYFSKIFKDIMGVSIEEYKKTNRL